MSRARSPSIPTRSSSALPLVGAGWPACEHRRDPSGGDLRRRSVAVAHPRAETPSDRPGRPACCAPSPRTSAARPGTASSPWSGSWRSSRMRSGSSAVASRPDRRRRRASGGSRRSGGARRRSVAARRRATSDGRSDGTQGRGRAAAPPREVRRPLPLDRGVRVDAGRTSRPGAPGGRCRRHRASDRRERARGPALGRRGRALAAVLGPAPAPARSADAAAVARLRARRRRGDR